MKKLISIILSFVLVSGMTACGKKTEEANISLPKSEESSVSSESKILIAYFSWADNTVVTDKEAAVQSALDHYESVGDQNEYVDAVSSASVVQPGNVAQMADWIQQYVGGELFPITVTESYPSNYDECLDRASEEKADAARPDLSNHVENMDDYDIIFLGFPNWWSTAPMAIFSFIEEYDLSDKTIVPFCAHGTGGIGASVKDITAALPESTQVLEPIGIYRADMSSAQSAINEWLDSLGFIAQPASEQDEIVEAQENIETKEKTIVMTIGEQEAEIILEENPLAEQLYEMLPLELNFDDFNNTEKISYLPDGYSMETEGSAGGHDPAVGDLCLYKPWGNLCIFYQDFHASEDLYKIGQVEIGMDVIAAMRSNVHVIIDKKQ